MSKTTRGWLVGAAATLLLLAPGATGAAARSLTADTGADVTNGRVRAIAQVDGKTVLGGDFDYVGPQTGAGVPFTRGGAIAARYPQVVGEVYEAVADGSGGVFVAGEITHVGGLARQGVAHIRSDGTVDAGWDANLEDSSVHDLAVVGSRLYIEASSSGFRALRATDGGDTGWDPGIGEFDGVDELESDGSTLYVAGSFDDVDGTPRDGLAAYDGSGTLTAWDPGVDGRVGKLAAANGVVYAAGSFTAVGGATRGGLAALDPLTGDATAWDPPSVTYDVMAIAATSSTVYVGGTFWEVGGQTRHGLAAIDASSGTLSSWAPDAGQKVHSLAISGTNLVVGGGFTAIDGSERYRLAAFDTTTERLLPWHVRTAGQVSAIVPTGDHVYVGGQFASVGGVKRDNVAALDGDGKVLPWSPNPNGMVRALAVDGTTVVAGGEFTEFGGQPRSRLAAIDGTNGSLLSWDPEVTGGAVRALTIGDGRLYAGGTFTAVDGDRRTWLAAFETSDGSLTPFAADITWSGPHTSPIPVPTPIYEDPLIPGVYALDEDGGTVYAGGLFDGVGGQTRTRLAAFDSDDATLLSFSPTVTGRPIPRGPFGPAPRPGRVNSIVANGATVYVGGQFISAGGSGYGLAALDATSGAADTGFAAGSSIDDISEALVLDGTTLYSTFNGVRAIDTTTGAYDAWTPAVWSYHAGAMALSLAGDRLDVGGELRNAGAVPASGYARFDG
ncbi:hypothetical protein VSS74_02130 [Conexibacter stalactiti]|uniref:Uncharacterized protein n=1 Tax=Conexibacter stalactiti TaxID=1940611 RepID=A0ABU4HII8_9ACTN|nr:hypothetical protein [Conexibacter stalactiti]MDW5593118.1 hypothetical protein [Conexibacter stalactiti]MEC5033759.1 hypothetical protein [Conexibacter stalactiti]